MTGSLFQIPLQAGSLRLMSPDAACLATNEPSLLAAISHGSPVAFILTHRNVRSSISKKLDWRAYKRLSGVGKQKLESCFGLRSRSALLNLAKSQRSSPSSAILMNESERLKGCMRLRLRSSKRRQWPI